MKPPPMRDTEEGIRVEGEVVRVVISFCTLQLLLIAAKNEM